MIIWDKREIPLQIRKIQVDMVHSEQVETYCEKAKKAESADVVIYSVIEQGGVVRYELHTYGDDMGTIVSTVRGTDNKPCMIYYHKFKVHSWKYTEKGYFFIEEYHLLDLTHCRERKDFV